MAKLAQVVLLLVLGLLAGAEAHKLRRGHQKFWPFSSSSSAAPAASGAPAAGAVPAAAMVHQSSATTTTKSDGALAKIKAQVLGTDSFQKKVAQLCKGVAKEDERLCAFTASDRMFCAMFARSASKFASMDGVKEEQDHCASLDTMENSKEAAADLKIIQEQRQEAREDANLGI